MTRRSLSLQYFFFIFLVDADEQCPEPLTTRLGAEIPSLVCRNPQSKRRSHGLTISVMMGHRRLEDLSHVSRRALCCCISRPCAPSYIPHSAHLKGAHFVQHPPALFESTRYQWRRSFELAIR